MTVGRRARLDTYRSVQRRFRPDRRHFERLVTEALEHIPAGFLDRLENVAIVVEEWPSPGGAGRVAAQDSPLGLYRGMPITARDSGYHLVPPDQITIYRGPILALCRTRAEVIQEIRDTVVHEVGHYFGLEDHELD
jgi:predicted Zn-dependent protease with MMP-like domain